VLDELAFNSHPVAVADGVGPMRKWHGNPWASLLVICFGFFMTLLDLTIVNIAIPDMQSGLSASLSEISWVLNAYMLVLVVLLITAGRLGDLIGAKRLFLVGLVIFTASSVLCGLSQGVGELIAARAVQGLGAAIMMPQTLTILTMSFPPAKRGAAFGIWGGVAGIATIAGPTLGGLLVTSFSWRWIFFINVPIGVLTFVAGVFILTDVKLGRRHRLDMLGVVLASLALVSLTYGIIEGPQYNWGTVKGFVSIPLLIGVGVALLAVFFVQQRMRQGNEPLLPFALFRDRNYAVMNLVSALVSIGMLGLMLPFTIYLQSVLGFTALRAGLTLAPFSLMSMCVAPVMGKLSDRIGGKYILFFGLLITAAGYVDITLVAQANSGQWATLPGMLLGGFGIGCVFAPMASVALRNIEPAMAGAASGVMNTVRQLGSVVGNVSVIVLLQSQLSSKISSVAPKYDAGVPAQLKGNLVNGLTSSAKSGLATGAGQNSSIPGLPANLPQQTKAAIGQAANEIFRHGYVEAMKPTLVLPIVALVVGALACLIARSGTGLATRGGEKPAQQAPIEMGA
jgi:EmrB/QacA subfamily drug resistance transporter